MLDITKEKRLFIGNVPAEIKEADLETEFNKFGYVKLIELKSKVNFQNPEILNYFAFITLEIEANSLEKCLNYFKSNQVRSHYLLVTVARESFLDRLKRERETNVKYNEPPDKIEAITSIRQNFKTLPQKQEIIQRKRFKSSESDSSSDEDSIQIVKKSANHSLQNGKIMIEKVANRSITETSNSDKADNNILNNKAKLANQKRLESLNQKNNEYSKNKKIIQQALVAEVPKSANKILFDDNDPSEKIKGKPLNKLFEEDSENEKETDINDNFKLRKVFEGQMGEKLFQIQSGFQLDGRFRMNENFANDSLDQNSEYNTNGKKVESTNKQIKMIRFDPSKASKEVIKNINSKDPVINCKEIKTDDNNEVSKGQFYEVHNDFTNSFNNLPNNGFSLLSLFNQIEKSEVSNGKLHHSTVEKLLVNKSIFKSNEAISNNSSDDENEEHMSTNIKDDVLKNDSAESFFIGHSDQRLEEGFRFFKPATELNYENYAVVRNKLRLIINKKLSKIKNKRLNEGKFQNKGSKGKKKNRNT